MQVSLNPTLCAGSDLDIVNAARRSFNASSTEITDADVKLIHFLVKEGHWLPFRHPQVSFSCEAPIYVARQLGKHQVGMSWSEVSRRYKTSDFKFFIPEEFREDHPNRKQGRGEPLPHNTQFFLTYAVAAHHKQCLDLYQALLDCGLTPEQARGVLPQSMEVYWTWTGSLLSWLHLIRQRTHQDAQKECEDFARMIATHIETLFPHTWSALCQHGYFDGTF